MPAKNPKILFIYTFAASSTRRVCCTSPGIEYSRHRSFHLSAPQSATPLPIGVVGPPPNPPLPAAPQYGDRIERRRKQAEMLRQGKEIRASQTQKGKSNPLKKRFWKDVDVKETPGLSIHASPIIQIRSSHRIISYRRLPNLPRLAPSPPPQ